MQDGDNAHRHSIVVDSTIKEMTLTEKIGQMTLVSLAIFIDSRELNIVNIDERLLDELTVKYHVGAMVAGGGSILGTHTVWRAVSDRIQTYASANTRLSIPLLLAVDAIHGHNNVVGATIFPHNTGLAATWNPELARAIAAYTALDMRSTGFHWTFAPTADLGRDPRWGRFYETFGEDPYLASRLVAASVKGFQGDSTQLSTSNFVAATMKHFIGYSQASNGRDRHPSLIPLRTLLDVSLPAFVSGVEAGVATTMASSGAVNNIPVHASRFLLTELLRTHLEMEGVLVSDWNDAERLFKTHRTAFDYEHALEQSLNAGIDLFMIPYDHVAFFTAFYNLLEAGLISEARLDASVRRILELKNRLDLKNDVPRFEGNDNEHVAEGKRLAYQAASESITLLKNTGVLPIHNVSCITIYGSIADNVAAQLGGWTVGWKGVPTDLPLPPIVTIVNGLRRAAPEHLNVSYSSDVTDLSSTEAQTSDVAILVLGEGPYAEFSGDSVDIAFPEEQQKLIDRIVETDTPLIVVIVSGRPLLIPPRLKRRADGLIMAYLAGSETGTALADIIFGEVNPSGKLPFTWPQNVGQIPFTYDALPARKSKKKPIEADFDFGHGLSFSTFDVDEMSVSCTKSDLLVSVTITNQSGIDGRETVQLFLEPDYSTIMRPRCQLIDFLKVSLKANTSRSVLFKIPLGRLAITAGDVLGSFDKTIPDGVYDLRVRDRRTRLTFKEQCVQLSEFTKTESR